jgi:hypothetical protein
MAGAYRRAVTRRRDGHAHGPVAVGAAHHDAELVQHAQGAWCGMAVLVVGTDPDDGDLRPDGAQERGVGRGSAVVRHGEQLGREGPRDGIVGLALQQVGLGREFGVAGEQRPAVPPGDPRDDRAVVELAARPAIGPPGIGPQDGDLQVTDPDVVPGDRAAHGNLPDRRRRQQLVEGG